MSKLQTDDELQTEPSETERDDEEKSSYPEKEKGIKQIFIAHGKNTDLVDQLKNILIQFHIPYTIAEEESNQGRPISKKVSELMHECSCAIFIFTKEEEKQDSDGNTAYVPNANVVFELGAASVLYENKIVIFKQEGVEFGSGFTDLGYISFEEDLNTKAMELIKELVDLGLLKISPT